MNFLATLTAALNALAEWFRFTVAKGVERLEDRIDELEDEIDKLAADGSAASKLRMERLAQRRKRKLERLGALRSSNGDNDSG